MRALHDGDDPSAPRGLCQHTNVNVLVEGAEAGHVPDEVESSFSRIHPRRSAGLLPGN